MKQDCTNSPFTANERKRFCKHKSNEIQKGTSVSEPKNTIGSVVEFFAQTNLDRNNKTPSFTSHYTNNTVASKSPHTTEIKPIPWCYLYVHHKKVRAFEEQLQKDNCTFFVHTSIKYVHKKGNDNGYKKVSFQTVSGLIFIKGYSSDVQAYLDQKFPPHRLCRNRSTGQTAEIPNSQMEPFMRIALTDPERIRFLLRPFAYYAQNRTLLRITTGQFAGLEGYVIRIARDRKLIIEVGGMSVAIGNIHAERFEEVNKNEATLKERQTFGKRNLHERNAFIDHYFHQVKTAHEAKAQAENIDLLRLQTLADWHKGILDVKDVHDTLYFIIEEIDYYYAPLMLHFKRQLSPILEAGSRVLTEIERLITTSHFSNAIQLTLQSEYEALHNNYGYLFE